MEIKLTGWKGLLAALVVLGFLGFRYVTAVQALDTDGRKAVREWIASEYQRYHLARDDISDEQKAAILLKTRQVDLVSMDARGKPELMAVRIEIEPDDAHPPGSPTSAILIWNTRSRPAGATGAISAQCSIT